MARKTKTNVAESSALTLAMPSALADLAGLFDPAMTVGAATASGGIAPFLKLDDGTIMDGTNEVGDTLDVVILGVAVEHALYPTGYNPDKRDDPVCFYVGSSEKDAAPDKASPAPQATSCVQCAKNAFGSHPSGRGGKACGQRRRLLVLVLGDDDDADAAPLRRLRVPPTSVGFLKGHVDLVQAHKRPVESVVTTIEITPDPKHKFHVNFKPKRPINDRAVLEAVARRAEQGKAELFSTWTPQAKPGQVEAKTGRRVVKR